MKLTELHGLRLKDDAVIDALNDYRVGTVTYDFERLKPCGTGRRPVDVGRVQLRFGEDQVLDTIFCYLVANEGFTPIVPDIIGADSP